MIYISTIACLAVSCKMRRHKGMTFFCENVKISETVLEYQAFLN